MFLRAGQGVDEIRTVDNQLSSLVLIAQQVSAESGHPLLDGSDWIKVTELWIKIATKVCQMLLSRRTVAPALTVASFVTYDHPAGRQLSDSQDLPPARHPTLNPGLEEARQRGQRDVGRGCRAQLRRCRRSDLRRTRSSVRDGRSPSRQGRPNGG